MKKNIFKRGKKYYWAFKYDRCVRCHSGKLPHKVRGLCIRCWDKERDTNPQRQAAKKEIGRKWREKNREKIKQQKREYYLSRKGDQEVKKKAAENNRRFYHHHKNDPEFKAKLKIYAARQKAKNPEEFIVRREECLWKDSFKCGVF